jgi:hypothetical protein
MKYCITGRKGEGLGKGMPVGFLPVIHLKAKGSYVAEAESSTTHIIADC